MAGSGEKSDVSDNLVQWLEEEESCIRLDAEDRKFLERIAQSQAISNQAAMETIQLGVFHRWSPGRAAEEYRKRLRELLSQRGSP